jgi:hypothetical protein
LLASGCTLSAGHTVRKLLAVAFTIVTFKTAPVAVGESASQFPKFPRAFTVIASPLPSGVVRGGVSPVAGPEARVSSNRHGVIGTKLEAAPPDALTKVITPPAPMLTATAAPKAAHRAR